MAIDPIFANQARDFATFLSRELIDNTDLRTYKDSRWRDYKGHMRVMFGAMGTDLLRWTVTTIRQQNQENRLLYNHPRRFDDVAQEILKNAPPYNSESSILTPRGSAHSLFLIQVKDNIILPALNSRPGSHLRLV